MRFDLILLLLAGLTLTACPPTPRGDDDDDATDDDDASSDDDDASSDDDDASSDDDDATGDDDDATDDDDETQEEFAFTFTPDTAIGGAIGTVNVDLGGMDPTGATECCNDHVNLLQTIDPPPPGGLTGFFFFGILGDGPAAWGLESDAAIGEGTFSITPLADIDPITAGAGVATDVIDVPLGYDVYSLEVPADSVIVGTAHNTDAVAAFSPSVWLVEPDGSTLAAFSSTLGEIPDSTFAGAYSEDAGTWFVRVMDFGTGGDPSFNYSLDVSVEAAPTPIAVSETEPNDSDPWEFLGQLGGGFYEITGQTETAGWQQTPEFAWTGDLDGFSFSLSSEAQVEFELDWAGDSDLDMVVYGFANGTPNVGGFDAEEVIAGAGATLNHPETASVQLAGSTTYVVMVANFKGDPNVDYTLEMRILQ